MLLIAGISSPFRFTATEDLPVGITYIGEVSENGRIKKKNGEECRGEGNKGLGRGEMGDKRSSPQHPSTKCHPKDQNNRMIRPERPKDMAGALAQTHSFI